jgi:hypothetical protein
MDYHDGTIVPGWQYKKWRPPRGVTKITILLDLCEIRYAGTDLCSALTGLKNWFVNPGRCPGLSMFCAFSAPEAFLNLIRITFVLLLIGLILNALQTNRL